ncbi:hypothetical protein DXG01_002582 [Tephrocybe rancida]|nr:hypothetical protein DXG01_002582 [Tephrocybe rancida]
MDIEPGSHHTICDSLLLFSAPSFIGLNAEHVVAEDENSKPPSIASFLDALVAFFPVNQGSGRVFAMTLTLACDQVTATVATHRLTPFQSTVSHPSPEEILHKVWSHVPVLCQSTNTHHVDELTQYLLKIRVYAIQETFQQGIDNYEKILSILSARAEHSPALETLIKTSKGFLGAVKSFCDNRDASYFALKLPHILRRFKMQLRRLLKGDLKLLNMASLPCFTIPIFLDKLYTPMERIAVIMSTLKSPTFQHSSTLPFQVTYINNMSPSTCPNSTFSESYIAAFYRDNYSPAQYEEQDIIKAIDNQVSNTLLVFKTAPIMILQPHSESLLIRHHHLSKSSEAPFPYIAVSRPSCIHCRLYIKAYNIYGNKFPPFSIHGRLRDVNFPQKPRVGSYVFPDITEELDALIVKQLMAWIRDIVTDLLNLAVKQIANYRKTYSKMPLGLQLRLDELMKTKR